MPRISVLLPFRDAAPTVGDAVRSVLAQRGVEVELVAIDDGSRDEGPAIVAAIARELQGSARDGAGARLLTCSTGGVGIAGALEAGLGAATAPLVARMDADDLCHPERLARELARLDADPGLAAVGSRVRATPLDPVKGGVGAGLARYVEWQNGLTSPEEHARQIFVESPLCHPSVLLRRDALERVGGWRELPWPEDYDLWLRFDEAGWRMAKVPEVLLEWRHRPERTTFTDPRTSPARLLEGKAPYLARRLARLGRPVVIWGAGKTGKRVARALEPHGIGATSFVDIDPRKIGGRARDVPVRDPSSIAGARGQVLVVVAVGAPGARDIVRARLDAMRFSEGEDYLCAA